VRYRLVVCIDRWPAVAITAIGEAPVAARFVSAACRSVIPARLSASSSFVRNSSAFHADPFVGCAKT